MDIDREGLSRIKELLKNNPRGMNVTEIAREIGMNRLSVAKYLEMLVISGHIDVKAFGPSKVYFLSQRLPISAMLSLSSDFIVILDKDLRIINVNDKFLEFTNSKRNDILFQKLDKLSFPIEFRPSLIPSVTAALNGKNFTSEAYFKKRENESFFNIKFIPLVLDDGQKGVTILFEDITDKKRIELAVKESEHKLRSIIEQSMDGITLTDELGRIIEYNKGEEEIVGIAREKAIGMYIWDLQASLVSEMRDKPEFRDRIKASGQKILETGEIPAIHKYVEREIDQPDGSKKTIHAMTFSIKTEKGFMVCGITRDITDRKRAEQMIKESEARLRAVFEGSFQFTGLTTVEGVLLDVNRPALELVNLEKSDVVGMKFWETPWCTYSEEIEEKIRDSIIRASRGEFVRFETTIKASDGSLHYIDYSISPIRDDAGKIALLIPEGRDITDLKRVEEALRESDEKFRVLAETSTAAIFLIQDDRAVSVNKAAETITGYSKAELLNMKYLDIVHPDFRELVKERNLARLRNEPVPSQYEIQFLAKDGETRWAELTVGLVYYRGKPAGVATIFDITERKRIEEALRKVHDELEKTVDERTIELKIVNETLQSEIYHKIQVEESLRQSEADLQKAQKIARLGFWQMDIKNKTCQWSDGNYLILDYRVGECIPCIDSWMARVHPDDRDIVIKKMADIINDKPYSLDYRIVYRDGSVHYMHDETGSPIKDETGKTVKLFGTIQDVTELHQIETALLENQRKLEIQAEELRVNNEELEKEIQGHNMAQEALRASEVRFRSLIQNSSDIIRILDKDGLIIYDSPSSVKILGYPEGYMLGKSPIDFIHPDDLDTVQNDLGEVFNKKNPEKPTEFRIRKANGEYVEVESVGMNLIGVPGVDGIVITTRPIAERKKAEEAMRQSEEMLRIATSAAEIGVLAWSSGMDHEVVNDYWKRIYGLSSDTLVTFDTWYNAIHPEDRERVIKEQKSTGEQYRVYDTEYRIIKPDGAVRWVADKGNVRYDANGNAISSAGINIDITERKLAEAMIQESENKFRGLVENISDGVWEMNKDLAFTYMSPRTFDMVGYNPDELLGKTPYDLMNPREAERVKVLLSGVAIENKPFKLFEFSLVHKDGHIVNVEISGDPIFSSGDAFVGYRGITRDVTQRNKDKYDLSVANRSLRLLSDCNRALIQSIDERALLTDICHILVDTGEYRLAWVGYKETDAEKSIRPVADAGNDTGYLDTIKLSWSDECTGGMGPGGMAIRNGNPFILRWDGLDGQFEWWRKEAIDRGITSIIGLPLMENGQAFGVLLIYSNRMDAFDDAEVELLKELSDNISYSVTAIRARSDH